MILMLACGGMVLAGLVLAARWSGRPFEAPPPLEAPSATEVARRYVWSCSILIVGGIAAGVLVIGAGGRLAMRLLAVTAGDGAQGRVTEADQIVGDITLDGTIGFVLFIGIFGGVIAAAVYLVLRRLLPAGPFGGVCFGAGLLVVLGTRVEPLRDENPDFDIVGPGWLSVLVFTALALAFGVVLAAFVARLSQWLPLPSTDRAVVLRYIPIAAVAAFGFSVTLFLALVGVLVVAASQWQWLVIAARSRAAEQIGRVLLVAVVVASSPAAVQTVAAIIDR